MQGWPRPAQPVAPQCHHQPIAAQERDRWLAGSQDACEVTQACRTPCVVRMADRAGAMQDWGMDAMRREPDQRAACLMRATCDRHLAPGAAQRYVWAERQQPPALGTLTIDLARPPERPPRPATLTVTAKGATLQGDRRPGGQRPPVTVSAV